MLTIRTAPEGDTMSIPEEINLKMLERSVAQHENARERFFRDLKIVATVFLVLGFFCFVVMIPRVEPEPWIIAD